jgi:hypothetical protein
MGIIPSRNPWQRRTIPVQEDLPCVYCGYNLRGLALSGRCPECGGSIWDALLRRDILTLRRVLKRAGMSCLVLASWPLVLAMLISLSPASRIAGAAALLLLAMNAICAVAGSGFWAFMTVGYFPPGDKEQQRIIVLTSLTFLGVTLAGAYIIALGLGPVPAGGASATRYEGLAIAWDAVILLASGQLIVVLGVPARILLALHEHVVSRLVQLIQILCIIVGVFALGSLALELTPQSGTLRVSLLTVGGIAGTLMTLTLAFAGLRFVHQGTRPG